VVLTPGVCASSLSGDAAANRRAHRSFSQGDGGNSASLPGESTKDTVKTIRAGKAKRSATPVIHPVCIVRKRTDLRVPQAPGLPCALWHPLGGKRQQASGRSCRGNAKACPRLEERCVVPTSSFAPISCPGRSAASLRRCAAEPGPMQQRWAPATLGPGSAQQRKNAAARPGHERELRPHLPSHRFSRGRRTVRLRHYFGEF